MDDMNAFENQIARVVQQTTRPPRPVDVMSIVRTTTTQSPKWRLQSMFSAAKFVVAGVIVALFGGFLMVGVLTQPSDDRAPAVGASASATAESLPTMEATSEPAPALEDTKAEQNDPTTPADLPAGTFSSVESLAGAPMGTATLLHDSRVLLVDDTRAEVWDPATDSLIPAGELETPRPYHRAVLLADGRVLVVGGDHQVYSAEVWDPATRSFSPAGSFSEWHSGFLPSTTLLPDGLVVVMGGGDHHSDATQVVEVWEPGTATFRVAGEMAENRAEQTATLLSDGRVLVVGGELLGGGTEAREEGLSPLATTEIWEPETFLWSGSLGEARALHTATLLLDGRVLVVGGGDTYDYETSSAETWDPATRTFGPAGSLTEARARHTATLLPDGRVLVIGGWDGDDLASAEIWDPATASFSPAGSLLGARDRHSATLLPDGRVLVTGGGKPAEIWERLVGGRSAGDATTTPRLLPGVDLVTEEVEPGVERIVSDGIRDLSVVGRERSRDLAVTPDGAAWLYTSPPWADPTLGKEPTLFKLGDPDSDVEGLGEWTELKVDASGALWARTSTNSIRRLGGEGWSHVASAGQFAPWDLDTYGAVWLGSGAAPSVARTDASGRQEYPVDFGSMDLDIRQLLQDYADAAGEAPGDLWPTIHRLWVDTNGDVWAVLVVSDYGTVPMVLLRFDGETWSLVDPLGVGDYYNVDPLDVGPDGTMWVYLETGTRDSERQYLARLVEDRWTVLSEEDGVFQLMSRGEDQGLMRVGHDGAVWVAGGRQGLRVFDGDEWRQYLDDREVIDLEIAPDGKVWVLTDGQMYDLYLITPEAVAASE